MKQSLKTIIIATGGILGISLSVFFLTFVVLAWTGPQHTPPTCGEGEVGCEEVLHTGASAQEKEGGLLLNTGGATNGLIVSQGNVGIGVESPTAKLEVAGKIKSTTDGFEFPDGTTQITAAGNDFTNGCYYVCGYYGVGISCSPGYVVTRICGSGANADCACPNGGSSFTYIRCCKP